MSTGVKFRFGGGSAGDRVLVLRKECELLSLDIVGHREVVVQLLKVMDISALSPQQAREVSAEVAWRRRAIGEAKALKKRKQDSIHHMAVRQRQAQQRMEHALKQNERMAA